MKSIIFFALGLGIGGCIGWFTPRDPVIKEVFIERPIEEEEPEEVSVIPPQAPPEPEPIVEAPKPVKAKEQPVKVQPVKKVVEVQDKPKEDQSWRTPGVNNQHHTSSVYQIRKDREDRRRLENYYRSRR